MIRRTKFLAGWYRLTGDNHFSNVKLESRGEHKGKWVADIRRNSDSALMQYAGVWNTKKDAIEEVERLLNSIRYN